MPAPDVVPPRDSVAIRYVSADGAKHLWTAGPGAVMHTVRLLLADDPQSVDLVRWDGEKWIDTDENCLYGFPLDEDTYRRMMRFLESVDDGDFAYDHDGFCGSTPETDRSVEHRASL